jgi:geranylgeranyl diphosphate synthase type I
VTGKPVHGDLRAGKKTFPVLAALESPAPAARRLARLLESGGDPAEAAVLVEEAGGRVAALAEARRQVSAVEAALAGVPLRTRAAGDLSSLLDFLVRRDL